MTKWILSIILIISLPSPACALEISPPEVPQSGLQLMPEEATSFGEGLSELLNKAMQYVRPDLAEASQLCVCTIIAVMIVSILHPLSTGIKKTVETAGVVSIAVMLLSGSNSMIQLGAETIRELSDYGKLLLPVMTTAMSAQGGVTASVALYAGTAVFDTFLSSLISKLLVPLVYLFLALAVTNAALDEDILKRMRDFIKNAISWLLKTILIIFTTYMSITGVVSGTTDAAALKATKVTISSVVPVVGGILSDASEAVLISAGMMKNAAGIYGILAVLAIFLEPFIRIGCHYLILKATAAVSSMIGCKSMTGLIDDFASAMGLILAMTGSVCLLLLISTVCFMKGVG